MSVAQGTAKEIRIKRQVSKGALAGATLGQKLRRESGTFELQKESYTTESEITSTRQVKSSRHGVKQINGSLNGINSPGTYSDILSSILRKDFAAVTPISTASFTIGGTVGAYTITRAAGSYLTDGIKIGMVIRLTAGSFNAANLNKNFYVTAVTALVITGTLFQGVPALVTEGPIASATMSVPGKVSYMPDSSHTNIYYTVEEWYSDAAISERNLDVKFTKADVAMPGSGNSTIKFSAIGLDQTADTTAYFTSPAAETSTDALVAANGLLLVNGVSQAIITELSISIDGKGAAADGVIGTNIRPDVFSGNMMVSGSFSAYFDGGTVPDLFRNETTTSIMAALTSGSSAASDFQTFTMKNVKLNTSTPDDNQTGLKRSYSFVALYNSAGGTALADHATTLMVHDSQAA